ncbi:hypothetical protein [Streptomyces sp. NPDC058773]|uniref:hypothetical protein n=1 Tax=Streptomyces sp. NPDC058773 TaxID=3346632 RepID=UPI0036A6F6FA
MFRSELEIRVRHEELRREADRQRLVRLAEEAGRTGHHAAARSGNDEPEGRVRARSRWARVRRVTA